MAEKNSGAIKLSKKDVISLLSSLLKHSTEKREQKSDESHLINARVDKQFGTIRDRSHTPLAHIDLCSASLSEEIELDFGKLDW